MTQQVAFDLVAGGSALTTFPAKSILSLRRSPLSITLQAKPADRVPRVGGTKEHPPCFGMGGILAGLAFFHRLSFCARRGIVGTSTIDLRGGEMERLFHEGGLSVKGLALSRDLYLRYRLGGTFAGSPQLWA